MARLCAFSGVSVSWSELMRKDSCILSDVFLFSICALSLCCNGSICSEKRLYCRNFIGRLVWHVLIWYVLEFDAL